MSKDQYESISNYQTYITSDAAIQRVGGTNLFQNLLFCFVSVTASLTGHFLYNIALFQDTDNIIILCRFLKSPEQLELCTKKQACDSSLT